MSFGADGISGNLLAGLNAAKLKPGSAEGLRMKQLEAAFKTQMAMTNKIFSSGNESDNDYSGQSLDDSIMGDSLMYDALSSLASIMRQNSGNMKPLKAIQAYESSPAPKQAIEAVNASTPEIREALGSLSAMFESGSRGIEAIGYDRTGGTSYGKFQIASKVGTMDSFLSYLEGEKPEWAARLKGAGPADTGSKEGGMPTVWKELADKYPEEFEAVQTAFIRKENYDPARLKVLDATGIDMDNAPKVVQDVLWSTSVQHGATGAARIFSKVVNSFIGEANGVDFNQKLIEGVYDTRKDQFGSSTKSVRNSVQTRLTHEKELALSMLGQGSINKVV